MSDILWSGYVAIRRHEIRRQQSAWVAEWLTAGAFPRDIAIERGPVVARIDGDRIIIKQEARIV